MECTLTSMRPTIVPSSSMELDRFVDGVNANPPRKTAPTRKPHDIQRLATTQPRSAVRQPAVVRDTNAVPREPSMVPRPTNGQRRAAGVSQPWFAIPTLYRENRASFGDRRTDGEERRASARRGSLNVIIADRASQITCRLVSQATAGLRQPLLVVRCWSLRK
jgi:hypothetical protein